jgi:hypothetical protein
VREPRFEQQAQAEAGAFAMGTNSRQPNAAATMRAMRCVMAVPLPSGVSPFGLS